MAAKQASKQRSRVTRTGHANAQHGRIPVAPAGTLIVIGGREDKEYDQAILKAVARRVGKGRLVVATLASEEPQPQWNKYRKVFADLGVRDIVQLDAREREDMVKLARDDAVLEGATAMFFAGGDQLKITSRFGGTELCERMREIYEQGGTIAGTSSGASAMSEVMIIGGEGRRSLKVDEPPKLAPGLGLIAGVVIDQHFAERGRMSRLIASLAQNPRVLGIGIDEDTALVFEGNKRASVLGSGAVYVLDGANVSHTTAACEGSETLSVHGLALHVLSRQDGFDLVARKPILIPPEDDGPGAG